ncbi:excalibur calcium-binding domain-containing protein [Actinopolyspora sp. H202]|uniref:excalibur calcium-binding domain-containing protein n=1 Tax=Actinopolyspora sp. H202 TaxID=1500456 RepID=UPI003EE6F7F6
MPEPKHTGLQLALYTLSVLLLPVFLYLTWQVESPWPRLGCTLLVFGCQLLAKLLRHRQLKRTGHRSRTGEHRRNPDRDRNHGPNRSHRPTPSSAIPAATDSHPPPDKDCSQLSAKNFRVRPGDPHRFDSDGDGLGCEG